MASGAKQQDKIAGDSVAALPGLKTLPADQLPPGMPPEMFTAPGMLAIADALPVMTAFYDNGCRLRFLNRMLADWLEKPR